MGVAYSTHGINKNYIRRLQSFCRGNIKKIVVNVLVKREG
jgi:hypothetical protein